MKNSARILSAILAAMLCATAFSACANNSKPPVTDIPAITTGVLATDAPLVTTEPPVTDAPIVTTETPVTTEAPSTTDDASVGDDSEVASSKVSLKDVMYYYNVGYGGYVKIDGADSIRLPVDGGYSTFKGEEWNFFASSSFQITEHSDDVPAYYTHDYTRNKIKATNSTHDYVITEDVLTVKYGNGTSFSVTKADYPSGIEDPEVYISYGVTVIGFRSGNEVIVLSTRDCGNSITKYSYESEFDTVFSISFYNENCGYVTIGESWGGVSYLLKTTDRGATFEKAELPRIFNSAMPNFVFANESTAFASTSRSATNVYACATYDFFQTLYAAGAKEWRELDLDLPSRYDCPYLWAHSQPLKPYFEGDIGVWPIQIAPYEGSTLIDYLYLITLDGGKTWEKYDPADAKSAADDFKYRLNGDGVTILKYIGNEKHVIIPEYIQGMRVTKIADSAFAKNVTVEGYPNTASLGMPNYRNIVTVEDSDFPVSVVIPSSVTEIGDNAFMGCKLLETLVIPDSVGYIGESAFSACLSLREVKLSGGLRYIDCEAFAYCESLEKIDFPHSLRCISNGAFRQSGLKSVVLPDNIEAIGWSAFAECDKLESVVLSKNLKTIPEYAFDGCSALSSVIIPEGVEVIEKYAFVRCTAYKNIELPDSITHIYTAAFHLCEPSAVTLSENLIYLGKHNFSAASYCLLDNNVYYLGTRTNPHFCVVAFKVYEEGSFSDKILHRSDAINKNAVIIAPYSTVGCDIEGLILPDGVRTVMEDAVSVNGDIVKIDIPTSVKYIYQNSFTGSVELNYENDEQAFSQYREDYFDPKHYHGPIK